MQLHMVVEDGFTGHNVAIDIDERRVDRQINVITNLGISLDPSSTIRFPPSAEMPRYM